MQDKHPIDKVFRAGLSDPDTPFDERDWKALSRKMHPRKRWPLLVWMGSGIAAAVVIAAVVLFGGRNRTADHQTQANTAQSPPPVVPRADPVMPRDTTQKPVLTRTPLPVSLLPMQEAPIAISTPLPTRGPGANLLTHVPTLGPIPVTGAFSADTIRAPRDMSLPRGIPSSPRASSAGDRQSPTVAEVPRQGWTLGIVAAPDLSGTGPLRGKLSGNIGLTATYRLSERLSITGGVLYAKKLYQTEFANYQASGYSSNPQSAPGFVDADCNVLDIPVNINFDIIRRQRSTWFASAGASSYFMLSETYDYRYPPNEYDYPKRITIRNENRHILGIGNISIGYRRKLSPALSITVQPFVKVPLTGIGNGKLKLYSSGVAVSADINLMRRAKQ